MGTPNLAQAKWRKSSYSGGNGACVEIAELPDKTIAVRNSNHPEAGIVLFTAEEMDAFIRGVRAGDFNDLAP